MNAQASVPAMARRPASLLDLHEEDGGLAGLGARSAAQAPDVLHDAQVRVAAQDELRQAFASGRNRQLLDPFAPADVRNAEIVRVLRAAIARDRRQGGPLAAVPNDAETLLRLYAATAFGWGPIQPYLDDLRVTEIKINGTTVMIQEIGQPFVTLPNLFASVAEVQSRVLLLASLLNVKLDRSVPQATLPVSHGSRMHVSIAPRVVGAGDEEEGILVCIRRGRRVAWDLGDLLARGALSDEVAELLRLLIDARCSFLIAGSTGSGKTALLEAIANSWAPSEHVLTIEDNTQELIIRNPERWTREGVNTQENPGAFGQVAREALRQTPGLLAVGEIRAQEAGAVLSLLLSGHAVATTIHAETCAEAIERIATCAALPGSYMYEGRWAGALRDAASGFQVIVKVEAWGDVGTRVITQIALCDGVKQQDGVVAPVLVPLVDIAVREDGGIGWACAARPANGLLIWAGDITITPARLHDKLLRARVRARALEQVRATSLAVVQETVARAEELLASGEAQRALNTLRRGWAQRRDHRLLVLAQRAIGQGRGRFGLLIADAESRLMGIERAIREMHWEAARRALESMQSDLGLAAAVAPDGGWELIETTIATGQARLRAAHDHCATAEDLVRAGRPRTALDLLEGVATNSLPADCALSVIALRERAMEALVEAGEADVAALAAVRAQRVALERANDSGSV